MRREDGWMEAGSQRWGFTLSMDFWRKQQNRQRRDERAGVQRYSRIFFYYHKLT